MDSGTRWAAAWRSLARSSPPYPPYPYPYQAPPAAPQGQPSSADSGKLGQLQLLGELHESGTLTDDEFECEKLRILRS